MKTCKLWVSLLLAVALLLPAGFALAQDRIAQIEDAKQLLDSNPTFNNRLRLATLQYLHGVDLLQGGDLEGAIDNMQAGVWTLEDGQGMIPETHPVFEEARYGLGYALLENDNPYEALLVLDQLVEASPGFGKARYLLGVTLVNIPGQESMERAVNVMQQLAQDGQPPYDEMAAHAATRFAYNISTLQHAQGNAADAAATLQGATGSVGMGMGASSDENDDVQFASGVYLKDSGDLFGAMDAFESLHGSNPNYRLNNGVALSGVLSNTYYGAALDQLQLGGEASDQLAVNLFQNSADVGDSSALDVQHGLAVAYTKLGDTENAIGALERIVEQDPRYYDRIKAQ